MTEKYQTVKKKHFIASHYNKFASNILNAKIKEKCLIKKSDIFGFINNSDLEKKIKILTTKAKLKAKQNKINKLETNDSSLFIV